ncbi:MAG: CoA-acylating methylmalonate-semialdehyde dehydrogenase [Legionella sp.]|nr:CoA-acylating methylmalonate-semialdehyde dehydrogenase [Legionella sp.]
MHYTAPHYLAGRTQVVTTPRVNPIWNPALGESLGQVYFADTALVEKAVSIAKDAWPAWAVTTPTKRGQILFRFRELLERYQRDLACLVTKEHGKTLADAQGSVMRAIELVELYCGLSKQLQGSFSADVSNQMDCYTLRQPLGVCLGISPFNFPVMVPIWMLIPAIACGNTFILKPSEQDPSATVRLFELLGEAGLPAGVANLLQGDKTTVEQLIQHPDVAAVTAVASTAVAKEIYTTATALGKRACTFGGAKNHAVIMPDADLAYTAKAVVGAAFGSAGERCMAISAVVTVGRETAEHFLEELTPLIRAIRVGPGEIEENDMGPVVSQTHRQRIIAAIDRGVTEGARLLIDGRHYSHPQHPEGYFLGPSLFDQVDENMSIYQQEIFGPVLVTLNMDNFEEALALVNRHPYGNGATIFTKDGHAAREYSHRVQAGMVGINVPIPVPLVSHPFGGWKQSSFGDTNMHGVESMHFYTRRKTVTSRWPSTPLSESHFTMPVNQ